MLTAVFQAATKRPTWKILGALKTRAGRESQQSSELHSSIFSALKHNILEQKTRLTVRDKSDKMTKIEV